MCLGPLSVLGSSVITFALLRHQKLCFFYLNAESSDLVLHWLELYLSVIIVFELQLLTLTKSSAIAMSYLF